MTQLAAYALDRPRGVNLPAIERAAQFARDREYDLQTKPGEVALKNAQNAAGLDEESSLAAFRMKAKKGDPDAAKELKGYPEKYKKVVEMFDGMDPEDWAESKQRATAFGQAARTVMAFKDGSKEQRGAWDRALGDLMAKGYIDKQQHDGMVAQGPDANIINEAIELDDFVKAYSGPKADKARAQEGLTKARIDDIGTDNERADELNQSRIDRNAQLNAKTQADVEDVEVDNTRASELAKVAMDRKDKLNAKTDTDIANVGVDNDRADETAKDRAARNKKLSAKTDTDIANIEADNIRADKKEGGKAGGMSEAETGRRVRDVQTKLAKLRNDGGTEEELAAEEKRLKREYGLTKAAGTADDPFEPATPDDAAAVPLGQYYITPKGKRFIRK